MGALAKDTRSGVSPPETGAAGLGKALESACTGATLPAGSYDGASLENVDLDQGF